MNSHKNDKFNYWIHLKKYTIIWTTEINPYLFKEAAKCCVLVRQNCFIPECAWPQMKFPHRKNLFDLKYLDLFGIHGSNYVLQCSVKHPVTYHCLYFFVNIIHKGIFLISLFETIMEWYNCFNTNYFSNSLSHRWCF